MGAALGIGDDQRRGTAAAPRPPGPLDVVGGGGRHVPQQHRGKGSDVDAELERGGTAQHVDLAGEESLLDVGGLQAGPLRGVLPGDQRHRRGLPVQGTVVAVVVGAAGDQLAGAAQGRAHAAQRGRGDPPAQRALP